MAAYSATDLFLHLDFILLQMILSHIRISSFGFNLRFDSVSVDAKQAVLHVFHEIGVRKKKTYEFSSLFNRTCLNERMKLAVVGSMHYRIVKLGFMLVRIGMVEFLTATC